MSYILTWSFSWQDEVGDPLLHSMSPFMYPSHLLNLYVLAVCRNNLQLHVFGTNGFELVIWCFMCSSELVMCLLSTFQAHWSVRRRLTVFYGCRSLAGGATTLPLPTWRLCFLLLRALIGNLDHMYFFIILGHVGKSHVRNKTLARLRETVGIWYTLITRFNSSIATCSNINIVQTQTMILTN
jgi:hypothetical protein